MKLHTDIDTGNNKDNTELLQAIRCILKEELQETFKKELTPIDNSMDNIEEDIKEINTHMDNMEEDIKEINTHMKVIKKRC